MPIIFITGYGDVPTAVQAMKAGAVEFLTKRPVPSPSARNAPNHGGPRFKLQSFDFEFHSLSALRLRQSISSSKRRDSGRCGVSEDSRSPGRRAERAYRCTAALAIGESLRTVGRPRQSQERPPRLPQPWKDADPDIPSSSKPRRNTPSCSERTNQALCGSSTNILEVQFAFAYPMDLRSHESSAGSAFPDLLNGVPFRLLHLNPQ